MKKIFLLTGLFIFSLQQLTAQKPEDLLQQWYLKSPVEKTWLHTDKDYYAAGETIWFKAYLSSDFQPDTLSSVLIVELRGTTDKPIVKHVFPVVLASSFGQIELPDSLNSGNYQLCAYTPTMLNNGKDFIFRKQVLIKNKKSNSGNSTINAQPELQLKFFPEGGNFVSGFSNTVAFKATDKYGMPVDVSGTVFNSKGKKLTDFKSVHDGMGYLELNPEAGETYTAKLKATADKTVALPEVYKEGVVLSLIPHPQGAYFEIHQRVTDPLKKAGYMIGQMQHHVVFRQSFATGKNEFEGVLNTTALHSGILQVTVFTNEGLPLAERLFFVNNGEYKIKSELRADTLNTNPKGRNNFKIVLKDTVQGSLSVSITDADFTGTAKRTENIWSGLLLTADIKGDIHNPAWYFSGDADSVKTGMDLLMMTQGWRRFSWEELPGKVKNPLQFSDPSFISITGRVKLDGTNKGYGERPLLALINAEGLKNNAQLFSTDKEGNFRIDSLLFFGNARIFILDIRGKKSKYIDVKMTGDSLGRPYPVVIPEPNDASATIHTAAAEKMAAAYDAIDKADGLVLEEVTLNVKKKTPTEILDETYTRGMFSGQAGRTYDLVNTDEFIPDGNIFDYLLPRVPGLDVAVDGFEYKVYYRQGPTASSLGSIPMTIYLNEIETDPTVVATLPASEIALVKVYSTFTAASGAGAGGVLAIYTRKGGDVSNKSRGDLISYKGFTVVKEFYVPDYKKDPSFFNKPDNRITIDWRPNIFVNNINPVIPISFYNNDRTKRFRVVVEGMTTDGKLICVERIVE